MFLHDTRTQSRKVYNEYFGNIELDCVYGDLLNDYLNYFLPINERYVTLPSFASSLTNKLAQSHRNMYDPNVDSHSQDSHVQNFYHDYPCLFKRSYKKSLKDLDSLSYNEIDHVGDMKKIDSFINLINEILILPFSSSSPNSQKFVNLSPKSWKCDDSKQVVCNVETIFALTMILKHSHFFSNAFRPESQENSISSPHKKHSFLENETSMDELRANIFKIYWRKSFYKFFAFNLEHWPLQANVKWIIELWLTYIQPLKFFSNNSNSIRDTNSEIKLNAEFIKENYIIYNEIYQLILKRYCFMDLSNEENLNLIYQILIVSFFIYFLNYL